MLTCTTPDTATPSQKALHQEHVARQQRMLKAVPKRLELPKPAEFEVSTVKAAEIIRKFRVIEWVPERNFDAHVVRFHKWQAEQRDGADHFPTMADVTADFRSICPVPWPDIASRRKNHEFVVWRQALGHALCSITIQSLVQIGRHMGGRDHTTVLHAKKRVEAAIDAGNGYWTAGPCGHRFFIRTGR